MDNFISILITTRGNSRELRRTIKSINNQILFPKEIIIVSNNKIERGLKINRKIKLKSFTSSIKNQVHQRNIGIRHLSKKSKIVLQLDDRVVLDKKCILELNMCWKRSDKSIVGIGINQKNKIKTTGILDKLMKNNKSMGKVFSNGVNFNYLNLTKNLEVMWLKGGLSSWDLKKNKRIKNRKFPLWNWCVNEDVDFSLGKKKNEKLMICHKAKAFIVEKRSKISFKEQFNRGALHTFSQKMIVKKYFNKMTSFYLSMPLIVVLSLLISVLTLNISKFFYSIGRSIGFFKINFY